MVPSASAAAAIAGEKAPTSARVEHLLAGVGGNEMTRPTRLSPSASA